MSEYNDIDELIIGYLTHQINDDEKKRLLAWLQMNPSNRAYFNHFQQVWIATYTSQKDKKIDTDAAWLRFIERQKRKLKSNKKADQTIKLSLLRIAAVFLFVALTGILSYYLFLQYNNYSESKGEITKYTVPLGSVKKISLKDGTEVWLNAGSEFHYYEDYNKATRSVYLIGEGYFKVFNNPKKPFIVHTHYMDITALGTEFNVKSYQDDKEVASILVKGKIEVKTVQGFEDYINNGKKIILIPHEKLIYSPERNKISILAPRQTINTPRNIDTNTINYKKTNYDPVQETLWKDDIMVINAEKLQDLAKKLERRYNIKIEFENRKVKKYTFTGTLKNESLDQVLKAISLSAPVNYKIEGKKVILTENKDFLKEYEDLYKDKQVEN
ncbi:MAG TPA: FecR family protein [Bacteroidales bacterium]|nr:FecR family protein [Bacteroidales bacterium]